MSKSSWYMAPEQVRGLPCDHRADIFAFGCVLYEMVSGQRAFKGATPGDTMSAILKENPPPLTNLARQCRPGSSRSLTVAWRSGPRTGSRRRTTWRWRWGRSRPSLRASAGTAMCPTPGCRGWHPPLCASRPPCAPIAGVGCWAVSPFWLRSSRRRWPGRACAHPPARPALPDPRAFSRFPARSTAPQKSRF